MLKKVSTEGVDESQDLPWRLHCINAGIPQVFQQNHEQLIPQMVNLDIVNGLDFKKGCYPGQEIIARLRYLGKLKQRMGLFLVQHENVQPGDPIYSDTRGEQQAGTVIDAVMIEQGNWQLLATVPVTHFNAGKLFLQSTTGPTLQATSLPYSIPELA